MEVRFFKRNEKPVLMEALDRIWRKDYIYVRNPEVMEHLMWHSPRRAEFAGNENYSFLGLWDDEGVVRGVLGLIPQWTNVFGKKYNSVSGALWAVEMEAKKKVNGMELMAKVLDMSPDLFLVLQLTKYAYPVYEAMGWNAFKDLSRWVVIVRRKETMEHLLPDAEALSYLPDIKERPVKNSNYRIEYGFDSSSWDEFYKKKFAPMIMGPSRDSEFLNWRYVKAPVFDYRFLSVFDSEDKCHGLAVVRIESILGGTQKIGRILEFIAVEAEPSVMLANAIVNFDREVLIWDFYCLSSVTAFGLECVGFKRLPEWMDKKVVPTLYQPIEFDRPHINGAIYMSDKIRGEMNLAKTTQWYITKGDANIDTPR